LCFSEIQQLVWIAFAVSVQTFTARPFAGFTRAQVVGNRQFQVYPIVSLAMAVAPLQSSTPENRPIRILVADDHEVMRMGIRNLLETIPEWSVYAEAKTGREAVDIALLSSPDVIIMDITMPEMNGLEAAARISQERPEIPVIMFSLHLSEDVVSRFRTGTIRGAVAKSEAARDLLSAVRSVLSGGTFFPERQSHAAGE
jgi:CheY-like chemotaxis protein